MSPKETQDPQAFRRVLPPGSVQLSLRHIHPSSNDLLSAPEPLCRPSSSRRAAPAAWSPWPEPSVAWSTQFGRARSARRLSRIPPRWPGRPGSAHRCRPSQLLLQEAERVPAGRVGPGCLQHQPAELGAQTLYWSLVACHSIRLFRRSNRSKRLHATQLSLLHTVICYDAPIITYYFHLWTRRVFDVL